MLRAITGIVGTLCLATTLACSGGSDTAGGDNSLLSVSFVTDEPSPGDQSAGLTESSASSNLVTVGVQITGTSDIFTAGFDLNFDPSFVEYVSWGPGSLLETGGQSVVYNVAPQADRVVVGASRTAPASGADSSGSTAVIQLTFRARAAGSSALTLTGGFLLDSQPPAPSEIPGISWSGGQILAN